MVISQHLCSRTCKSARCNDQLCLQAYKQNIQICCRHLQFFVPPYFFFFFRRPFIGFQNAQSGFVEPLPFLLHFFFAFVHDRQFGIDEVLKAVLLLVTTSFGNKGATFAEGAFCAPAISLLVLVFFLRADSLSRLHFDCSVWKENALSYESFSYWGQRGKAGIVPLLIGFLKKPAATFLVKVWVLKIKCFYFSGYCIWEWRNSWGGRRLYLTDDSS